MFLSIDWLSVLIGLTLGLVLFNLAQLLSALIKRQAARKKVKELETRHRKLIKAIQEQRGKKR